MTWEEGCRLWDDAVDKIDTPMTDPREIAELAIRKKFSEGDESEWNIACAVVAALEAAGYGVKLAKLTLETIPDEINSPLNPVRGQR